jgi:hypothetical protein
VTRSRIPIPLDFAHNEDGESTDDAWGSDCQSDKENKTQDKSTKNESKQVSLVFLGNGVVGS